VTNGERMILSSRQPFNGHIPIFATIYLDHLDLGIDPGLARSLRQALSKPSRRWKPWVKIAFSNILPNL